VGYLKDFKSDFDETWHAGNARLSQAPRPSVGTPRPSVGLRLRVQQLGGGLHSMSALYCFLEIYQQWL